MTKLKLYITGHTPRSQKLLAELKALFDENCGGNYTLEVIDVFDNPETAYQDGIFATPTVMKMLPPPARKIVGRLLDRERMLEALEIESI